MTKQQLRNFFNGVISGIPPADKLSQSNTVMDKLLKCGEVESAADIFIYISTDSEINTLPVIDRLLDMGKSVYVPKIFDSDMIAVRIGKDSKFCKNKYGILEPLIEDTINLEPSVVILPGLSFTLSGERLGRGKGYYDRFLAAANKSYKIGICFREQLAPTLPTEEHDIKCDKVIFA